MSYDRVTPTYYQTFQPGTPFHPGAPGWTEAPYPTWGENPNLAGRRRLATDGLGRVVAISGLGADMPFPSPPPWLRAVSMLAAAASAYHGYRRNDESIGWAFGWAFFGSVLPVIALPVALAQGFGKPKKMHSNRRRGRRARR